jgi:alkylation response protein AidB-like acyl-CoA dehydrogenase
MIDFSLTPEQKDLQAMVKTFVTRVVRPLVGLADRETDPLKRFLLYKPAYEKAAELGLTFAHVPKEYGGTGIGGVDAAIINEELSAVDPGFPMYNDLAQIPIMLFGTKEQKEKWLKEPLQRIAEGKKDYICGFAASEPGGTASFDHPGSTPAGMAFTAEYQSGDYVLNGRKAWIAAGGWDMQGADQNLFVVRTDSRKGGKEGLSAIIVPRGTKGIEYSPIDKYGLRGNQTVEITCKDAHVPEENLLAKGMGDVVITKTFTMTGPEIAATAVGCARGAFESTLEWARMFTGASASPILRNQVVGYMLFDIAAKIEASRYLTWKAADYIDKNGCEGGAVLMASIAKVFATETCYEAAFDCMRVMGTNSVDATNPLNKYFRDLSIMPLYDGGNVGMQRRKGWGVMLDPEYYGQMLMDNVSMKFKKEMEGWGTEF